MPKIITICTLSLCILLPGASAAGLPLKSVITGSGGQISAGRSGFVVIKRTRDLTRFELKVVVSQIKNERVQDVMLAVNSARLKPSELELLQGNASHIASQCFGLGSAHQSALERWVGMQNSGATKSATSTFGPLKAIFVRKMSTPAYITVELYRETGVPGGADWQTFCTWS